MLQAVQVEKTPLQKNLDRVGHVLAMVALVVVALIVGLGLLRGQSFIEMLLFGIQSNFVSSPPFEQTPIF